MRRNAALYRSGELVRLLRAAQDGDTASAESLLTALHIPILDYLRTRAPDRGCRDDLAEDLAQEALIRIAENLHSCRAESDGQLLAWALTVARNRLVDYFRTDQSATVCRIKPEDDFPYLDTIEVDISATDRLLNRLLHRIVRSLPRETVKLLRLRIASGQSWREIGTAMCTTSAGAKRRFQRAQERMRRDLETRIAALPARERSALYKRLHRFRQNEDL